MNKQVDYDSTVTEYVYDANDNLRSVNIDPNGLSLLTQYTYDANDNPTTIISPNGHTTTLGYDFLTDDLIEENDGVNRKKWKYNTDGSLDSFTTKNNFSFKYSYYNDQLFPGTQFNGLLFSDSRTIYTYKNGTKVLYQAKSPSGKTNEFIYESQPRSKWNRPKTVNTIGFFPQNSLDRVDYEYDQTGRPVSVGYPSVNIFARYFYDYNSKNLGLVDNFSNTKRYAEYAYQRDGKISTETYGNGDSIFHHYDGFNREDSIWAKNKQGQLLYSIGATLDNNGRHTRENIRLFYVGQEVTTIPSLIIGDTKSYSYELSNRIITGDNKNYTSDSAGNIKTQTNPTTSYDWNEYGQLLNARINGVDGIKEYDALGNRKRNDSIYYVVDQQNTGNPLLECKASGQPISAYVYGNGLVARVNPVNDSTYYYHFDFRGSVIAITNQNGDIVKYYQYEPFGKVYNEGGILSWNNPFQYLGKHGVQKDADDLYYMKARYYQPSTGRFISEDPVWNNNLFVYCNDDPINNIDPSGRSLISWWKQSHPYWELSGKIDFGFQIRGNVKIDGVEVGIGVNAGSNDLLKGSISQTGTSKHPLVFNGNYIKQNGIMTVTNGAELIFGFENSYQDVRLACMPNNTTYKLGPINTGNKSLSFGFGGGLALFFGIHANLEVGFRPY